MLPIVPFIAEAVSAGLFFKAADKALTKYISPTSKIVPKNTIPMVKPKNQLPSNQKRNLNDMVSDTVDLISALSRYTETTKGGVSKGVKEGVKTLEDTSKALIQAKKEFDSEIPNSPLVRSQSDLVKATNDLVESSNNSILANVALFGTLDANLVNISAGLMAINRTLIEFSSSLSTASDLYTMREELAFTPRPVTDMYGVPIKTPEGEPIPDISPYELDLARIASVAQFNADTNGFEIDDIDLPSMMDSIPLVKFLGRSDIYNPDFVTPGLNPFMPQM